MDVTGTVDTRNPDATSREVKGLYERLFGRALFGRVEEAVQAVASLFAGDYPGYQRCDTVYHDLEHTLQVYLATARIFDGLVRADGANMPMKFVTLGLISALGHDTGFIKAVGDNQGRGSKYTLSHVERGKEFMARLMPTLGFGAAETASVNNIIACTGMNVDLSAIQFGSAIEREAAYIVGSGDYLGQMSDPHYVSKLPSLYEEYREGHVPGYSSADDLIAKTPEFFDEFVMPLLMTDFGGVYRFAASHFGGLDVYLNGIKANLAIIKGTQDGHGSAICKRGRRKEHERQ